VNKYDTNMVASIREVAQFHGWVVGLHGSTKRDLDLIATPWTENAAPFRHLLTALKEATGYDRMGIDTAGPDKPHGRYAVLLKHPAAVVCKRTTKDGKTGWAPKVLDISFVDRRITTDAAMPPNAKTTGRPEGAPVEQ
jgi:hypothetical protein